MNGVSGATYIELGLVQLGLGFLLLQTVVQLSEADHRYWQVHVHQLEQFLQDAQPARADDQTGAKDGDIETVFAAPFVGKFFGRQFAFTIFTKRLNSGTFAKRKN